MIPGLHQELLQAEIAERARRSEEAERLRPAGHQRRRRVEEGIRHAVGALLIRSGVKLLPESAAVRIPASGD